MAVRGGVKGCGVDYRGTGGTRPGAAIQLLLLADGLLNQLQDQELVLCGPDTKDSSKSGLDTQHTGGI